MADGKTSSAREAISSLSGITKYGLNIQTVVREEPRARKLTVSSLVPSQSGHGLSPSVIANRKTGFRSSLGDPSQKNPPHTVGASNKKEEGTSQQQKASERSPNTLSPTGEEEEDEDSGLVLFSEDRCSSPADVDMCMGLKGLMLIDGSNDTLVKEASRPFISVPFAIKDLLASPWRKYYQRPPMNTPGLLAIGEKRSLAKHICISPCLNRCCWAYCCCGQCISPDADCSTGMEVLLTYHSDDIALALNYSMQCAGDSDETSPLHTYIQQLCCKHGGAIEKKLFVKWVGYDASFPGVSRIDECRPIHGQVAECLGYWPRFNFYDHCLDIVKGIYRNELHYNPMDEYAMGFCQMCTLASYHWRGVVPEGSGWNQRDETYYHQK